MLQTSKPNAVVFDGRTKKGRFVRDARARLAAQVGGEPSATQAVLIERASMLLLHLKLVDERVAAGGSVDGVDGREYRAWSNVLSRTLRDLGIRGVA